MQIPITRYKNKKLITLNTFPGSPHNQIARTVIQNAQRSYLQENRSEPACRKWIVEDIQKKPLEWKPEVLKLFGLQLIGQTVPFLKTRTIFRRIRTAVRKFTHMAFRIPGTDTETSFSSFIAIHFFTFFLFRHSWRRSTQGAEFMVRRGEPGNAFHIPATRTVRAVTIHISSHSLQ